MSHSRRMKVLVRSVSDNPCTSSLETKDAAVLSIPSVSFSPLRIWHTNAWQDAHHLSLAHLGICHNRALLQMQSLMLLSNFNENLNEG